MLKRCKHSITTMSKKGFDYVCNKCGGVVVGYEDDTAKEDGADLINDLRAELDEEARMEEGVIV